MKTYEDILREHGWKPGLWQDNFSKRFVYNEYKKERKAKKLSLKPSRSK